MYRENQEASGIWRNRGGAEKEKVMQGMNENEKLREMKKGNEGKAVKVVFCGFRHLGQKRGLQACQRVLLRRPLRKAYILLLLPSFESLNLPKNALKLYTATIVTAFGM